MAASGPPLKKHRKTPCHCHLCNGDERDHRTIKKHSLYAPVIQHRLSESPRPPSSRPDHPQAPISTSTEQNSPSSYPDEYDNSYEDDSTDDDEPPAGSGHRREGSTNREPDDMSITDPLQLNEQNSPSYPDDDDADDTDDDDYADDDPHDATDSRLEMEITDPQALLEQREQQAGFPLTVIRYVMKELELKLKYGNSRTEFEEHLRNAKSLLHENMPDKWGNVVHILKKLGYKDPCHYRVCLNQTHSFLLTSKHEKCLICDKSWKDCIDYYVLGLGIEEWFQTEEQCYRLMQHWREKDTWLNDEEDAEGKLPSELWHGARFKELAWFWDPSKTTLLPGKCESCKSIISKAQIEQHMPIYHGSSTISIVCESCRTKCDIVPQYMQGEPKNQAIIIHEDGWAPHSTSSHSVAAITVSNACSSKFNRSYGSNCRVYSFIPVDQLPSKSPHKYDAFLMPLIDEIESLYIKGKPVFFKSAVDNHSSENDVLNIRVMPLLITADMKAHAEIGLTCAGGRKGCRRCEVEGEYVPLKRHYYYGNFLKRYYFRQADRVADESRKKGEEVENAATMNEKSKLIKLYGVTGVSVFYRWYTLCGFDPVHDLVIDIMHVVLNLARTELELLLGREDVQGHCLLDRSKLSTALKCIPWTSELKDGRIPTLTSSGDPHRLGFWKTEEFMKFVKVAPYVLRDIVSKDHYDCFALLHRVCQLLFSMYLRVNGWESEHVNLLTRLLWLHAIKFEKLYGIQHCSENLEYSLHLSSDISRHCSPDNYWCFVYERLVRFYKLQSTNQKNLCKTFSDRANQLRFVLSYFQLVNSTITGANTSLPFSSDLTSNTTVLLESTQAAAIALKQYIDSNEVTTSVKSMYEYGIVIGSYKFSPLNSRQLNDVNLFLSQRGIRTDQSNISSGCFFKTLQKSSINNLATVYRVGETIIINDSQNPNVEWVMEITAFFWFGPILDKYFVFVDGNYFVAKTNGGVIQIDSWTQKEKMIRKDFRRGCVQPTTLIERKVMMFPNDCTTHPTFYLVIDPEHIDYTPVIIPEYED